MATDQGNRLQNVIDTLMVSYNEHRDIEHIGDMNIPAKESIINLTEDIQVLLFPGLIRQESFDKLNLPHLIGQKIVYFPKKNMMKIFLCPTITEIEKTII